MIEETETYYGDDMGILENKVEELKDSLKMSNMVRDSIMRELRETQLENRRLQEKITAYEDRELIQSMTSWHN